MTIARRGKLTRIHITNKLEWEFTVDTLSDLDTAPYNMIIGTDLLTELTMDLRFNSQTIVWDNLTAPSCTEQDQDKIKLAYIGRRKAEQDIGC